MRQQQFLEPARSLEHVPHLLWGRLVLCRLIVLCSGGGVYIRWASALKVLARKATLLAIGT